MFRSYFTLAGSMVLCCLISTRSLAQDLGATIAFSGQLDVDGVRASEPVSLRAALYDGAGEAAAELWHEEHPDVPLHAGRFLLQLGSRTPLSPELLRRGDLYLGVRVDDGSGTYPVALQGRKRFTSVPYAWGGAPGQAFEADGEVVVSGDGNGPNAGSLTLVNTTTGRKWQVPIRASDGDKLQFYRWSGTSWAPVLTLAMDGKVGVGTSAPADTLHVAGGLKVDGSLSSSGTLQAATIQGSTISRQLCGSNYSCTPRECLDKCASLGGRMATYDELFAIATGKQSWCSYVWHVRPSATDNACVGYPMYSNQLTTNCGRANTGDRPRIEGLDCGYGWGETTRQANCACSVLK